ncbi:hypothetical protein LTR17_024022 [Elasticomyces elasticus]|nr:hypothetical protein LTR17_024022 [Elasticomyces elasticus]
MSGVAEAATVYSLVTGTIEIIKTAIEIWEAVKDKDKLPRQLRVVAEKLPSIQQLLATSEQQYQLKRVPDAQWATAKQNVERCRTGCEDIRGIFDKAFPSNANAVHRAWTGTVTVLSGRGKKAEELFREVYQELDMLGKYHIVTNTDILAQLKVAVEQLGGSDKTTYQHYGAGPLSVNASSGTQHVNTNSGSGNWFQGPVNNPTFHSVVHYPQREDELPPNGIRKRFLDSLWFPEIDQRRDEVKTACPNTLEWIFTENPPDPGEGRWMPWASFASWLRSNDRLYWISGKAGSGKSTLMSHLIKDSRTVEALRSWAGDCKLLRLSYFFWRAGSALQNKVEGLLRTIAFQLYEHIPEAIDSILREPQYAGSRLPLWTERTLVSAIKIAIEVAQAAHQYISLFIDGLDEFLGEHDELVDLIFELHSFANMKCCVASRPEAVLNGRLKRWPHLRLQDLNRQDIDKFVSARLSLQSISSYDTQWLQELIVKCAEGVFLWAVLVTPSVIKGIESGDDHGVLRNQIFQLPKKLEDLFARMVKSIELPHQQSFAFYVRCLACLSRGRTYHASKFSDPNIALLTAARLSNPVGNYAAFEEDCCQTELQILGHSAGLLEIHYSFPSPNDREVQWETADNRFLVPEMLGKSRFVNIVPMKRQGRSEPAPYPQVSHHQRRIDPEHRSSFARFMFSSDGRPSSYPQPLYHQRRFVDWVHRSAYDYICPSDGRPSPAGIDDDDPCKTLKYMAQAAVELWMIMPSFSAQNEVHRKYEASFEAAIAICAELACAGDPHAAESMMDVLFTHASCLDPRDMPFSTRSLSTRGYSSRQTDGLWVRPLQPIELFWFKAYDSYPDYVTSRFEKMIGDMPSVTSLTRILYHIGASIEWMGLDDEGVAVFPKDIGGWSACVWKAHCMVSSPALLRLRLLEVTCQRARLGGRGMVNDQDNYKTLLQLRNNRPFATRCVPTLIHLDLDPLEESEFLFVLNELLWTIMSSPVPATKRLASAADPMVSESLGSNGHSLDIGIINGLRILFTALQSRFYVGGPVVVRKPWPYELLPRYQFFLCIPLELMLVSSATRFPNRFLDIARELRVAMPLGLCIMCATYTDDGFATSSDTIEFHLRVDIAETLASMLAWDQDTDDGLQLCIYGSDEDFDHLLTSMLDDIRANEQGLDTTQQLLMAAHVDFFLEDLRHSRALSDFDDVTSDGRSPTTD